MEFKSTAVPGLRTLYGDPVYTVNGDATMIECARSNWKTEHGTEEWFDEREAFSSQDSRIYNVDADFGRRRARV
jgi:hypothetical protein